MNGFIRQGRRRAWFALERLEPWIKHPLAVLLAAATAAALCGLVLHPRGLAVSAGLVALTALGLVWPWLSLLGLSVSVSFSRRRTREGRPVIVRLRSRNRLPWGAWGLSVCLRPTLERDSETDHATMSLAALPGWGGESLEWAFEPYRRGRYPCPGASISTGFPFGLRRARRPIKAEDDLIVWPRTFPVGPIPDEAGGSLSEGVSFRDRPGNAGDPLGVRPYRRGDPLRKIHWAQTARHDQLIVCERQSAAAPRVLVILDVDPESHRGSSTRGTFEWSVRIAASLLEDWLDQGAEAALLAGSLRLRPGSGTVTYRRSLFLDALAELEPGGPPLLELLETPERHSFGRGLVVIVGTDRSRHGDASRFAANGSTRWVLLKTSAFASESDPEGDSPAAAFPRPWIWIDDPERVPECWRLGRKEPVHEI